MNEHIKELTRVLPFEMVEKYPDNIEKFVELLKQAIWDEVKADFIEDEAINDELDPQDRRYLNGVNGGITDALYRIKQFGIEE